MPEPAHYLARIERALALVQDAAGSHEWPSLADLAAQAAMSPFHFHRIYRLATGETPQSTLSRVRLGASLPVLAGTGGIAAATERSGYATSQSYARALKSLTGATPSELRADPQRLADVVAAICTPAGGAGTSPPDCRIELVDLAPIQLASVRKTGDYRKLDEGYHALFERVLSHVDESAVLGLYGIPHDDPRDCDPHECRFDCAVELSADCSQPGDVDTIAREAAPALRLRLPGDYDAVHTALDELYRVVLALDLRLADDLPLNHYHHDPEEVPVEELLADIHLCLVE